MRAIDLNADLGEVVDGAPTADDDAMFGLVSSASIACGGHAGDAASMRAAVRGAGARGVAVGAHPSYPDRAGFGRRTMSMDAGALRAAVTGQLDALRAAGADLRYVKPHGALYHDAGSDPSVAAAVVDAVRGLAEGLGRTVPLLADGPALSAACREAGVPFVREAFLDRGYGDDGRLVPRGTPGDLLHDPLEVADRAVRLVREGVVLTVTGRVIAVDAASLCLHGDTPAAVEMARAVRIALDEAGIDVRAPW